MKDINFIITFVFLLFTGCKESATINAQLIAFNSSVKAFKREIPVYQNGHPDIFYTSAKSKQIQIGLDSLENGFDGLEIRIWYDVEYISKRKVIIIIYRNSNWFASIYNVTSYLENEGKQIFSQKATNLIPKSGWTNFSNRLLILNILTLPDGDSIENCGGGGGDGSTYNIEIATKMHYRFYGYWEPEEYRNKCQYAKSMSDILRLLESEFEM